MRRPNYHVFVYDHVGRYIETVKVWASQPRFAISEAENVLTKKNKDANLYTLVPTKGK